MDLSPIHVSLPNRTERNPFNRYPGAAPENPMAAQLRLQSSVYQWRVILWNLLAFVWLAAAGATGLLITQAHTPTRPVTIRLEQTLPPASTVVPAETVVSTHR
jgi:hypothetical protein